MSMPTRETNATGSDAATARPPSWRARLLVILIAGAITAAATYFAVRYFTLCGDCGGPPVRQHDV